MSPISSIELPACHGVAAARPAHCANPDNVTVTAHPINAVVATTRRRHPWAGGADD
ncbi:MAG: hypothetical protein ACRDRD_20285 [Pseudonocardiaceae bacterium]